MDLEVARKKTMRRRSFDRTILLCHMPLPTNVGGSLEHAPTFSARGNLSGHLTSVPGPWCVSEEAKATHSRWLMVYTGKRYLGYQDRYSLVSMTTGWISKPATYYGRHDRMGGRGVSPYGNARTIVIEVLAVVVQKAGYVHCEKLSESHCDSHQLNPLSHSSHNLFTVPSGNHVRNRHWYVSPHLTHSKPILPVQEGMSSRPGTSQSVTR